MDEKLSFEEIYERFHHGILRFLSREEELYGMQRRSNQGQNQYV